MSVWHVGAYIEDVYLHVPRLPREGESLNVSSVDRSPGGKAANQAFAVARLGTSSHLVAAVGRDDAAKRGLSSLHDAGVGLDRIIAVEAPTDESTVILDEAAQQVILTWSGASRRLTPDLAIAGLDGVQNGDYISLQGEVELAVNQRIITEFRDRAMIVLNPSPIDAFLETPEIWSGIDVLVLNETEALALAQQGDASDTTTLLTQVAQLAGVEQIVVTLGAKGAAYFDHGHISQAAAPVVNAIDPTGAGDGFTAGLVHTLHQGGTFAHGCMFGVLLGAYATERRHCFPGYPDEATLSRWAKDRFQ